MVEIEAKGNVYKETGIHVSISEIPRRKPVPFPAISAEPLGEEVQKQRPTLFSDLKMKYGRLDKRKKRIVIAVAVVIVLALLALIIGLAVGLTVGKKYDYSLPVAHCMR